MIYDIRHVTTYSYESPVASSLCTLRLSPRDGRGQRVLDSGIEIAPLPATRVAAVPPRSYDRTATS